MHYLATLTVVGMEGKPQEGHFLALVLKVTEGRIVESSYMAYPCPVAHSCGNFVANYVDGKSLEEAGQLDVEAIIRALGHMPLGREHCPSLAIKALRHALSQVTDPESTTDGQHLAELEPAESTVADHDSHS